MKIHWVIHIEYAPDGNDDQHFSACGVGRGNREGEEWESAKFKSEVTCKNCLKTIVKQERKPKALRLYPLGKCPECDGGTLQAKNYRYKCTKCEFECGEAEYE